MANSNYYDDVANIFREPTPLQDSDDIPESSVMTETQSESSKVNQADILFQNSQISLLDFTDKSKRARNKLIKLATGGRGAAKNKFPSGRPPYVLRKRKNGIFYGESSEKYDNDSEIDPKKNVVYVDLSERNFFSITYIGLNDNGSDPRNEPEQPTKYKEKPKQKRKLISKQGKKKGKKPIQKKKPKSFKSKKLTPIAAVDLDQNLHEPADDLGDPYDNFGDPYDDPLEADNSNNRVNPLRLKRTTQTEKKWHVCDQQLYGGIDPLKYTISIKDQLAELMTDFFDEEYFDYQSNPNISNYNWLSHDNDVDIIESLAENVVMYHNEQSYFKWHTTVSRRMTDWAREQEMEMTKALRDMITQNRNNETIKILNSLTVVHGCLGCFVEKVKLALVKYSNSFETNILNSHKAIFDYLKELIEPKQANV